jgi:hypothetical protein
MRKFAFYEYFSVCKEKRRSFRFGSIHQSVCGLSSCTERRQSVLWYVFLHVLRNTAEDDIVESRSEDKG